MNRNIREMTIKEFRALPYRKKWNKDVVCDSIILLPERRLHDSGFRCIDFIAVRDECAIFRLSGCSDVLHLDGIAGFGYKWLAKYGGCPATIPPSGWQMDCLPKSGLFRIWPSSRRIVASCALSSFEIYAVTKEEAEKIEGGKDGTSDRDTA